MLAEWAQGDLIVGETFIKTDVTRILMKLGAHDRVQAFVLAYEAGIVTPSGVRCRSIQRACPRSGSILTAWTVAQTPAATASARWVTPGPAVAFG